MTMIQLIACIGMIAGLFMVLHVSPRELSDSLFARLTAAPGSIRADINETTSSSFFQLVSQHCLERKPPLVKN